MQEFQGYLSIILFTTLLKRTYRYTTTNNHNKMASTNIKTASPEDIIKHLDLVADPEGGFIRRTYRADENSDGKAHSTAIYYLMTKDRELLWHKVHGSDELFHFYAGDPVEIRLATPKGEFLETKICGPDIFQGQQPQVMIPANYWQSAKCRGAWTLFGCTVSPGFDLKNFELATADWKPTGM